MSTYKILTQNLKKIVTQNGLFKIIDHDVNSIEFEFTDKNESILMEKIGYKMLNTINNNEEN